MNEVIANQAYLFLIYTISGILIGIFFDIFRILRKSFKTLDLFTYIEDFIFGIITGIFLIFMLFGFNGGQLRLYIFIAIILGLLIYMTTISKYFIKISVKIIVTIKNIITKIIYIIVYPIKKLILFIRKYILKFILKPFRILTINIKNIIKPRNINKKKGNFKNKNNSLKKKNKKTEKQKDLILQPLPDNDTNVLRISKRKFDLKHKKNVKDRKDFII